MNGRMLDYDRLGSAFDQVVADGQRRRRAALDEVRSNLLQPPEPARRVWWPLVVAPAVLAAALVLGWWTLIARDLCYMIDGEQQELGLWISADQSETYLEFSNGAEVVFRRSTKGRVTGTTADGAQLLVESGELLLHDPTEDTLWSITTGPYELRGTGADIELQWLPEQDSLRVEVREGSVELLGLSFEPAPQLRSGESIDVRQGKMIRRRDPAVSADGAEADPPADPAPGLEAPQPEVRDAPEPGDGPRTSGRGDGSTRRRRTPGATTDWRALAKREDYAASFALVEQKFDTMTRSAPAADLMRLADVARFSGHPGRATEALMSFRRRFPRHRDAATAAYTLGHLRASAGAAAEAERWFSVAVAERPGGPLHRSALGRLVKSAQRAGHEQRAKTAARRYLERYPTGPHADLAERIASQ